MADQQAKQYEDQAVGLEAQKSSLEVLLKEENKKRTDIRPLKKCSFS